MKTLPLIKCLLPVLWLSSVVQAAQLSEPPIGELQSVAELPFRPGNVSVTPHGRIFATVHPFGRDEGLQLVEISTDGSAKPWPSSAVQSNATNKSLTKLDSPLGLTQDGQGHLWVIDMGQHTGRTQLWGFDIATGRNIKQLVLDEQVAPPGSFVQDIVVDGELGFAYLADIAANALIAVNLKTGHATQFQDHFSLQPDVDAEMQIDGKKTQFAGQPARVGVNPLTLSGDGEYLFYGAMTGTHWYRVNTKALRLGNHETIAASVTLVGHKPVSDGAATSSSGKHYFTNLNQGAIDVLDNGKLSTLSQSPQLSWPDNVQLGEPGWLYVAVNQLHLTPAFTGGEDLGKAPYRIMRVWVGATEHRVNR
ncbi:L-dopachrome tautomerase-related protein [Pseudoalteromonas fenneropenaei]|uniref:L-dopachrome tautomerase-related protein n=1 Tax=Pseudoalteromonas fenneropenaei TaxID=1737459 RepID=A0ABV7CG45_9GAMM